MNTAIIVQARMSSSRLPGKVLRPILGKPMLAHVVDRLDSNRAGLPVVVATSVDRSDDPIARYCNEAGVRFCRGPLENVAARFLDVVDGLELDAFVRISSDSPLLDPGLVDRAVDRYAVEPLDLVTNVLRRTFPKGQSVEMVNADTFRAVVPRMQDAGQFEHVTKYFYDHADAFRIGSLESGRELGAVQMSVDELADLERVERILERLDGPGQFATWEELAAEWAR